MLPDPLQRQLTRCLCLGLGALLSLSAAGDSRTREQQLAEMLVSRLENGSPVWLETDDHEFLGLHKADFGGLPRRAVLLIHNMGGHPDWPEVIAPLRRRLPEHGWGTLSLQMPLLPAGALVDDYGETVPEAQRRIAAGVEYLRSEDYSLIVIVGYGFGAVEALVYQAEYGAVDGVISISVLARAFLDPVIDLADLLGRIEVPLLDLYGGNDLPEVMRKAEDRRAVAADVGHGDFEQQVVAGADHYFTGHDARLVESVQIWLNSHFGDRPAAENRTRD